MVNLIGIVAHMMNSYELYNDAMHKHRVDKDYGKLCLDSKHLLECLGEEKVNDWELRCNSEQLKRGIHALKSMAKQVNEDVIDEELVKSNYRKFKENSGVFMRTLFETYVMNE